MDPPPDGSPASARQCDGLTRTWGQGVNGETSLMGERDCWASRASSRAYRLRKRGIMCRPVWVKGRQKKPHQTRTRLAGRRDSPAPREVANRRAT